MPYSPPNHCQGAGCRQLAEPGRRLCSNHAYSPTNRLSTTERGYDGDWRKVRIRVLMANPWCVMCAQVGIVTLATEVDHIIPMSKGGLRLDPINLQPLCNPCHIEKTKADR